MGTFVSLKDFPHFEQVCSVYPSSVQVGENTTSVKLCLQNTLATLQDDAKSVTESNTRRSSSFLVIITSINI